MLEISNSAVTSSVAREKLSVSSNEKIFKRFKILVFRINFKNTNFESFRNKIKATR